MKEVCDLLAQTKDLGISRQERTRIRNLLIGILAEKYTYREMQENFNFCKQHVFFCSQQSHRSSTKNEAVKWPPNSNNFQRHFKYFPKHWLWNITKKFVWDSKQVSRAKITMLQLKGGKMKPLTPHKRKSKSLFFDFWRRTISDLLPGST